MGKRISGLLVFVFVIVGAFWWFLSKHKVSTEAQSGFSSDLPKKFMDFIELDAQVLAQSGKTKILKNEIHDPALQAYREEQLHLAIAFSYKQFVLQKDPQANVVYFIKEPKRGIESIFNQYGVKVQTPVAITFRGSTSVNTFIQVNDHKYSITDIDKSNYLWGAIETKIFHRNLRLVEEKLRNKIMKEKARKLGMSTQEFIESKIYVGDRSLASAQKENKLASYARNHLFEFPIKVNLTVPAFNFELKPDWTHGLGDPKSSTKVVVFTDFYSEMSRNLLKELPNLSAQYENAYFGFRPVFPKSDRFQKMLAEFGFCSWVSDQKKYWNFIAQAVHSKQETFEKDIYQAAKKAEIDLQSTKKCFLEQKRKQVVDYHLDYAKYLGIHSGPVVFIDGEVLTGGVTIEMIEKVLMRKTWQSGNI